MSSSVVVCNAAGSGPAGRRAHGRSTAAGPGSWAVGQPTLHGGPVTLFQQFLHVISKLQQMHSIGHSITMINKYYLHFNNSFSGEPESVIFFFTCSRREPSEIDGTSISVMM